MKNLLLSCCLVLLYWANAFSQDFLQGRNLATLKVDQISEADILKGRAQMQQRGATPEQAEALAIARGMPAAEAAKLRQRLGGATSTAQRSAPATGGAIRSNSEAAAAAQPTSAVDPKIFGSELFSNPSLTFEPNLRIATPLNYTLGPEDQLLVVVSGVQEASHDLTVSNEGGIYIPNVGEIKVSGLTVEGATTRIRQRMAGTVYRTLAGGSSRLSVTLSRIRSIRVTILGSVRPGSYTVSSLATVFNALFLCGGPATNGSYRSIEVLRSGKLIRTVDLYKFLSKGDQSDNVGLKDDDVIRIPIYQKRIEITGEVKRPGIFELLSGETFGDLLVYTSGFTEPAYRASVKVTRYTDTEKKVEDLTAIAYNSFVPQSGDLYEVGGILNRFSNRITINGAVFRPGNYQLTPGLRIADLIRRADGLVEDAFTQRALLSRYKEDLTREVVAVDIRAALNGDTSNNLLLRREDQLSINSIFDLRDQFTVQTQGEVRKPGNYAFVDSLSLADLILQSGGLTDAAYPQRIEIARVLKRDTLTAQDIRSSEILEFTNGDDLSVAARSIIMKPYDVVTVRRLPGFRMLENINVSGEVQFPGLYVLQTRTERVSDVLRRAGGLTPEAFQEGAYIKRANRQDLSDQIKTGIVENIQEGLKDSSGLITSDVNRPFYQIPLDLNKIMGNPALSENMIMQSGDELFIPKYDPQVKVNGEVLFPTQVPYSEQNSFKEYVAAAGGFTEGARKSKSYVIYANGKAATTKRFLWFKSYPAIRPGSEVVVPKYVEKKKQRLSTLEIVGLASAVGSLAGVVIAIINLSK